MPLPKDRIEAIKKRAEELTADFVDRKEAELIKERYIKSTVNLNNSIEEVLDVFEVEALPLLRDLYPTHPVGIFNVLTVQKERLRGMAAELIKALEPINNAAFKVFCADTAVFLLDAIIDNTIASATEMLEEEKQLS